MPKEYFKRKDIEKNLMILRSSLKGEIFNKTRDEAYKRGMDGSSAGGITGFMANLVMEKIDKLIKELNK